MNSNIKNIFALDFSNRLVHCLKQKGYISTRSASGVKINDLAKAIQHSPQMLRKYTLGEALPDHLTLLAIAKWLEVSPGWLIFGGSSKAPEDYKAETTTVIQIEIPLLEYILNKFFFLLQKSDEPKEAIRSILDIIYETSTMRTKKEIIFKIIDLSAKTAEKFHNLKEVKK